MLVAKPWSDYRLVHQPGPLRRVGFGARTLPRQGAGWDGDTHTGVTVHALRFHRRGVPRFQMAGQPCLVGSSAGCSPDGFALALAWLNQRCRFPFNEPLMLGMRRALEEIREQDGGFKWCEWLMPMDSDVALAFAGAWEFPPIRFTLYRP